MDVLERIITIADYYLCLPAVSKSMATVMFSSPHLVNNMYEDPCRLLTMAYDLRNKDLLRDCLKLSLGPWSKPRFKELEDEKLREYVSTHYMFMMTKLGEVQMELNELWADLQISNGDFLSPNAGKKVGHKMLNILKTCEFVSFSEGPKILMPLYYRKCSEHEFQCKIAQARVRDILKPLLEGSLLFNNTRGGIERVERAGEGDLVDFFLCYDVDVGVPWNEDDPDW